MWNNIIQFVPISYSILYSIVRIKLFSKIVLGTLGAILGSLAVVGVGINAANVGSLSTDQDSICTAVSVYIVHFYECVAE